MRPLLPATDRGTGIPLVLIHAFPLNQRMWRPQVEYFESICRIITFDLHGFGSAAPVDDPLRLEDIAGDILDLLDQRRVDRCVVGGLSLGGYIAFSLLRLQPERIRALVLADTRASGDDDATRSNRYTQVSEIRSGGLRKFLDSMSERLPGAFTLRNRPSVLEVIHSIMEESSVEGTVRMLEAMAVRRDSNDLLAQIDVPVCVISGEEDVVTTPEEMRSMAGSISGAEYHLIRRAGHLSNMEDPESFNGIMATFLKRLS